jgi:hypothetical protein
MSDTAAEMETELAYQSRSLEQALSKFDAAIDVLAK